MALLAAVVHDSKRVGGEELVVGDRFIACVRDLAVRQSKLLHVRDPGEMGIWQWNATFREDGTKFGGRELSCGPRHGRRADWRLGRRRCRGRRYGGAVVWFGWRLW